MRYYEQDKLCLGKQEQEKLFFLNKCNKKVIYAYMLPKYYTSYIHVIISMKNLIYDFKEKYSIKTM